MKQGLIDTLTPIPSNLLALAEVHPSVLHPHKCWLLTHFISPPPLAEITDFERKYLPMAKEAIQSSNHNISHLEQRINRYLAEGKQAEVKQSAQQFSDHLEQEIEFIQTLFENNDVLSRTPRKITSFAQLSHFIKDLYRLEYTVRINCKALSTTVLTFSSSLKEILACVDENDRAHLSIIQQQEALILRAKSELAKALTLYDELAPIVKEHIETTNKYLYRTTPSMFEAALKKLKTKSDALAEEAKINSKYEPAKDAAALLCRNLEALGKEFFASKYVLYSTFLQNCKKEITEARKVLKNHRGWKEALANFTYMLGAIFSLGLLPVVSKACTGNWKFFTVKTDSEKALDTFDNTLSNLIKGR
ncbi:ninein (plasmid) [Legionella adelaidensis]|uniref:Ninein n=1 Tax=Legionella adelaidensis TaxID=45056 RepID=A0A0W0R0S9_9GAMM|nr:hypothetical protein [Legionella adelaidensis]KTC64678.1 ninein [Legionella adelaidensis]VEH86146.1 ninein [Legionella adelaidensis]